jgi:hypothetical protein
METRNMPITFTDSRAALVVAHPGHELRIYQWLRLARPLCFVLTDGSGNTGKSRLYATTNILEHVGARRGGIYGRLTDQAIYSAMLAGDVDLFVGLAKEMARKLVGEEIDYVVGDASEGYNPAHDICRFLINAVVENVNRQRQQPILNFEIFLSRETNNDLKKGPDDIWLQLDEESSMKKLAAAQAYVELAADIDQTLTREGMQAIQIEHLCLASSKWDGASETPYYEVHGERQVAAGHYQEVVRYQAHIRPIADALMRWASNS